MHEDKIKGSLSLKMALDIINLMYTEENPKKPEIIELVEEHSQAVDKGKQIQFKTFEDIILFNQISTHADYLANLRSLFREHDYRNFGYISREQYGDILNELDPKMVVDRE